MADRRATCTWSFGYATTSSSRRQGYDIVYVQNINIAQAALGLSLDVPTLEGDEEIEILRGTQSGDVIRLRGKGIPHLRNKRARGDQLVRVIVETPKSLTDEQRELLTQLAESFDDGSGDTAARSRTACSTSSSSRWAQTSKFPLRGKNPFTLSLSKGSRSVHGSTSSPRAASGDLLDTLQGISVHPEPVEG